MVNRIKKIFDKTLNYKVVVGLVEYRINEILALDTKGNDPFKILHNKMILGFGVLRRNDFSRIVTLKITGKLWTPYEFFPAPESENEKFPYYVMAGKFEAGAEDPDQLFQENKQVELNYHDFEKIELYKFEEKIAEGELMVLNGRYCFRATKIIDNSFHQISDRAP